MNRERIYGFIGYIGFGLFLFGWMLLISHNASINAGEETLAHELTPVVMMSLGAISIFVVLYKNFNSSTEQQETIHQ